MPATGFVPALSTPSERRARSFPQARARSLPIRRLSLAAPLGAGTQPDWRAGDEAMNFAPTPLPPLATTQPAHRGPQGQPGRPASAYRPSSALLPTETSNRRALGTALHSRGYLSRSLADGSACAAARRTPRDPLLPPPSTLSSTPTPRSSPLLSSHLRPVARARVRGAPSVPRTRSGRAERGKRACPHSRAHPRGDHAPSTSLMWQAALALPRGMVRHAGPANVAAPQSRPSHRRAWCPPVGASHHGGRPLPKRPGGRRDARRRAAAAAAVRGRRGVRRAPIGGAPRRLPLHLPTPPRHHHPQPHAHTPTIQRAASPLQLPPSPGRSSRRRTVCSRTVPTARAPTADARAPARRAAGGGCPRGATSSRRCRRCPCSAASTPTRLRGAPAIYAPRAGERASRARRSRRVDRRGAEAATILKACPGRAVSLSSLCLTLW
jgi:hypothetical protein